MMKQKIYVGSIGIMIDLVCRDYDYNLLDLTGATLLQMLVKRPDGDEITWTCTAETNINPPQATREILRHTIVTDELDVSGEYIIQGKLVLNGMTIFSETLSFMVYENFE